MGQMHRERCSSRGDDGRVGVWGRGGCSRHTSSQTTSQPCRASRVLLPDQGAGWLAGWLARTLPSGAGSQPAASCTHLSDVWAAHVCGHHQVSWCHHGLAPSSSSHRQAVLAAITGTLQLNHGVPAGKARQGSEEAHAVRSGRVMHNSTTAMEGLLNPAYTKPCLTVEWSRSSGSRGVCWPQRSW